MSSEYSQPAVPSMERRWDTLVAAARAANAFVSPKLGCAMVDGVRSAVAIEAVFPGEVLVRMPVPLQICLVKLVSSMPKFSKTVMATGPAIPQAIEAACLAKLLTDNKARAASSDELAVDGTADSLWACYLDWLLEQNFDAHPYVRATSHPDQVKNCLAPSCLAARSVSFARQIMEDCRTMMKGVQEEMAVANKIEESVFLHAYLCICSHTFESGESGESGVLVPIADSFNHSIAPGLDWNLNEMAMVVTAMRNHAVGEQLTLSYGKKCNPMLFNDYGFTTVPWDEPAWEYVLQGRDSCFRTLTTFLKNTYGYDEFLPGKVLHLSSRALHPTLLASLTESWTKGHDAAALLRQLCTCCLMPYRHDAILQSALGALERRRAVAPASGVWWSEDWQERGHGCGETEHHWSRSCVRVKMSEYLCLTAHVEAVDFASGLLPEELCLEDAGYLRRSLTHALSARPPQRKRKFDVDLEHHINADLAARAG